MKKKLYTKLFFIIFLFLIPTIGSSQNILVTRGDTTSLYTSGRLYPDAYSTMPVLSIPGRSRLQNMAPEWTENSFSTPSSIVVSVEYTIGAVFSTFNLTLVVGKNGHAYFYDTEGSLTAVDSFWMSGDPEIYPEEIFISTDTNIIAMPLTLNDEVLVMNRNEATRGIIEDSHVDDIWFTSLELTDLIEGIELPEVIRPLDEANGTYSNQGWTFNIYADQYKSQIGEYNAEKFSLLQNWGVLDSGDLHNRWTIDLPSIAVNNIDTAQVSDYAFIMHTDAVSSSDPNSQNYTGTLQIVQLNNRTGNLEAQYIGHQLDDLRRFRLHSANVFDDRLYCTTRGNANIYDLKTLEFIGEAPHNIRRQVQLFNENSSDPSYVFKDSYDDTTSTGVLYNAGRPMLVDQTGDTIVSLSGVRVLLDGYNCAHQDQADDEIYTDVAHSNGWDAAYLDPDNRYMLLVTSWRNGRVDRLVSEQLVSSNWGLLFYLFDTESGEGQFLDSLTWDVNLQILPEGQHSPVFVENEFDGSIGHLAYWDNKHINCSGTKGSANIIEIKWKGGNKFETELVIKQKQGYSVGLGSNRVKLEEEEDTLGIGNTGYNLGNELYRNYQGTFYKVSNDFRKTTIMASIISQVFDGNSVLNAQAYQMDFCKRELLPNLPTKVSYSLSEDSSFLVLEAGFNSEVSLIDGSWTWNGSDTANISKPLYLPIEKILQHEYVPIYFTENPFIEEGADFIGYRLSVDWINARDLVNDLLGLIDTTVTSTADELVEGMQTILYPNPAIDEVFLKFDHHSQYLVQIYSMTGSLISSKEISGDSLELEKGNMPGGVYTIVVTDLRDRRRQIAKKLVWF